MNVKHYLALLAMAYVFCLTEGSLKAQYSYEIIDTTDGVTATYDSNTLIQSPLFVQATTATTNFNLTFEPNYRDPVGGLGGGIVVAETTPQSTFGFHDVLLLSDNQVSYSYYFPQGAFDTLGTFYSNQGPDYGNAGELIVSAVPEPGTWGLIAIGMMALFVQSVRRAKSGAVRIPEQFNLLGRIPRSLLRLGLVARDLRARVLRTAVFPSPGGRRLPMKCPGACSGVFY